MSRPFPHVAADLPAQTAGSLPASDVGSPHRLVIDGRPEQVSAARAFVRQVLGSSHPGAERVALLTSELVTNSIKHSNSRMAGGTVTVTLRVAANRVLVEVTDDGGATVPMLRSDDDLAETGRGLWLVDTYSLAWDYRRSGAHTVTWFECLPELLP